MKNMNNKVIAITGGGRGIGLAIAQTFAAEGARISLGDIDEKLARAAAKPLGGYGGQLDVRDRSSFAAYLSATEKALGPVDVLVNNAGIMPMGAFADESDAISDAQIAINVKGVILGCKLALPSMVLRGHGHIVNVASMAGVVPMPGLAVYCATKFAVVGLTQSLREEYRNSGVSFSTIMPSKVHTELASGSEGATLPAVSPEEVAQAVLDAVKRSLTEVTVPRYLGVTRPLLAATPHWLERSLRRAINDHQALEKIDQNARAGYNQRIAGLSAQQKQSK